MMRKVLLVFSIIIVISLSGCSQNIVDNNLVDNSVDTNDTDDISLVDPPQTAPITETTETIETASSLLPDQSCQPTTRTFDSIRTMKEEIEKRNGDPPSSPDALSGIDTSDLKELKGLDADYAESWVELNNDDEYVKYVIYYTTADSVLAFIPFSSEDLLRKEMEYWLLPGGTYENLLTNHLVTDVEFAELPAAAGTSYQCTYNTSRATGLILRYHTYTDPESNSTYILSETFSPDNRLQSSLLFVFAGDRSFMCSGNDANLTISAARDLYSSNVQ